jgi:hypothetical protein
MWLLLSPLRRSADNPILRKEETWQDLPEHSKLRLRNLLRGSLGSNRAAEKALEKIFALYAKECVDRQESPSATGLLRRAVQWLRAEGSALEPPDSDFFRILELLPLEFRLAFLASAVLQLEPEEAEDVLQESRREISIKAAAALKTLRQIQEAETVRR